MTTSPEATCSRSEVLPPWNACATTLPAVAHPRCAAHLASDHRTDYSTPPPPPPPPAPSQQHPLHNDCRDQRTTALTEATRHLRPCCIADRLYGEMRFPSVLSVFINSPEVQRTRDISQLGNTHYVYPCATHSRFEHSLGVAHLAMTFLKQLMENHREMHPVVPDPFAALSALEQQRDVWCVGIAALCHDLGHGPMSHAFEHFVNAARRRRGVAGRWCHEDASIAMLNQIWHSHLDALHGFGMRACDRVLIVHLIRGMYPDESWSCEAMGRPAWCRFLTDIVANKRSGLDVDKLDYIQRDSMSCLGTQPLDFVQRLFHGALVLTGSDGQTQICYEEKLGGVVEDIYFHRTRLHKTVYRHRVVAAIDQMMIDAFTLADEHFATWDLTPCDGSPRDCAGSGTDRLPRRSRQRDSTRNATATITNSGNKKAHLCSVVGEEEEEEEEDTEDQDSYRVHDEDGDGTGRDLSCGDTADDEDDNGERSTVGGRAMPVLCARQDQSHRRAMTNTNPLWHDGAATAQSARHNDRGRPCPGRYPLSAWVDIPELYRRTGDWLIAYMMYSTDPSLEAARTILSRLRHRRLYSSIGSYRQASDEADIGTGALLEHVRDVALRQKLEAWEREHGMGCIVKITSEFAATASGLDKGVHPLSRIYFYNPRVKEIAPFLCKGCRDGEDRSPLSQPMSDVVHTFVVRMFADGKDLEVLCEAFRSAMDRCHCHTYHDRSTTPSAHRRNSLHVSSQLSDTSYTTRRTGLPHSDPHPDEEGIDALQSQPSVFFSLSQRGSGDGGGAAGHGRSGSCELDKEDALGEPGLANYTTPPRKSRRLQQ